MSDPKYGDPVEDPQPVDDVVGSAREGLADAEAVQREADQRDAVSAEDWDNAFATGSDLPAAAPAAAEEPQPVVVPAQVTEQTVVEEQVVVVSDETPAPVATDAATRVYDAAPGDAYRGAVTASEPVAEPVFAPEPVAPQPIFVQAPEAPTPRGNRAAAGAIGLLAALSFAIIYLGAALAVGAVAGDVTVANVGSEALGALMSWWLWIPVAVFFLAFWLLGAILNRGRWGHWVIFGLLVGAASYGGHLLGQLFEAPFWEIAPSQAATLMGEQMLAPLAVVALVAGRELTIWFGAWVSARGKRVTELNAEAQREYERTLEAGPQLHRF